MDHQLNGLSWNPSATCERGSISTRPGFLGHGMGGDAAFDIGMSHPDYFAGVIPIIGVCDQHCKVYWDNAPELAWYVVGGEKDRDTLDNAKVLNRMMIGGYDLTYAEYIERGYESYFEEKTESSNGWSSSPRPAVQGLRD
ncbi:MAG: hypothetical protein R3C02_06440 [Planctomycetaceae bacterium]